ncbi:hypothetical protein D1AOALGA4SA_6486 [Olavius algarvensis Delta 1 endosymbiont]|nr:hypothetical protein D1AOALGA4SA_6486 [Olavius algarvensis Delta 1 endosymbiont]
MSNVECRNNESFLFYFLKKNGAQRFHQSEIRDLKSKILTFHVVVERLNSTGEKRCEILKLPNMVHGGRRLHPT